MTIFDLVVLHVVKGAVPTSYMPRSLPPCGHTLSCIGTFMFECALCGVVPSSLFSCVALSLLDLLVGRSASTGLRAVKALRVYLTLMKSLARSMKSYRVAGVLHVISDMKGLRGQIFPKSIANMIFSSCSSMIMYTLLSRYRFAFRLSSSYYFIVRR